MQAVDFVLYCLGTGLLLLSGGGAVRLMRRERGHTPVPPAPKRPEEPPVNDMGLNDRLRAFQSQRFASPIIRQQFERDGYTPSPGEPGGRRVVPPVRAIQPRTKPFSTPRQPPVKPAPKKETSNVVPFPQKQVPDDTTKKD